MAFNLFGRLGLKTEGFYAGLKNVEAQAQVHGTRIGNKMASGMKSQIAGIFAGYGSFRTALGLIDDAGEIRKQAESFGLTTSEIQKMRYAAEQANLPFESLMNSYRRFADSIGKARNGSEEHIETLNRLGISQEDLMKNNLAENFLKTADTIKETETNTALLVDVIKILGDEGVKNIAAFKSGIREMANEAERIGAVVSPEKIYELAAIGDQNTGFKHVMKSIGSGILYQAIQSGHGMKDVFMRDFKAITNIPGALKDNN